MKDKLVEVCDQELKSLQHKLDMKENLVQIYVKGLSEQKKVLEKVTNEHKNVVEKLTNQNDNLKNLITQLVDSEKGHSKEMKALFDLLLEKKGDSLNNLQKKIDAAFNE